MSNYRITPHAPENVYDTIYTVTANCTDCYSCVRACPVKAIRITGNQAYVMDHLCIKCGTCVRECPQQAKTIRSSLENARRLVAQRERVAISVAPAFASIFNGWRASRLPAALRMLGFTYITETAEGASLITAEATKQGFPGGVCTACPAVVCYVEMYRPQYLSKLLPVVSPMIAHGRALKERYGQDCAVIFVGPCAAKKYEARRPEFADAIDEVITFEELLTWMEEEGIDLSACTESDFEWTSFNPAARLFPLQGGMLKTGDIASDGTDDTVLHLSGAEEVMTLFDLPQRDWRLRIIEPLFCKGGCINGPAMPRSRNLLELRSSLIAYQKSVPPRPALEEAPELQLGTAFTPNPVAYQPDEVSEDQIQMVFLSTGKSTPEAQLNCGACGYHTCRQNAIAVVRGMAEPQMCMPYMRRLAQQRSDKVIETSSSGVVVLDRELCIINMNPAFMKMFSCNNSILGRRISYLVNADGYELLRSGKEESFETVRAKYGIRYHEVLHALRDEQQYVGTYTDISRLKFDSKQIDLVKRQTLEQAKELLDQQIAFSQEMAHYLGRSTAQNEEFVRRLMALFSDDDTVRGEPR